MRPTRLTYPCQQAAFGTAAAVFGSPFVAMTAGFRCHTGHQTSHRRRGVALGLVPVGVILIAAMTSFNFDDHVTILEPSTDYRADVHYVTHARGRLRGGFGGVDDLFTLMGLRGLKSYRSQNTSITSGIDGLIGADDVVLLKINAQWAERGGTNTDVIRGVIRRIVEHPDGFNGEIIVADNGQGSGSLNRGANNAENHAQSPQFVVDEFADEGWRISTKLWDGLRYLSVSEYAEGNLIDGYVVAAGEDADTGIRESYPKFHTVYGTYVSYKYGIWSPATETYDSEKLVIINMPVLKTHSIYAVTAAVKNNMGVVTRSLNTDSHNAVGRGGMGTILAGVRMPDLTILDCIWVLAKPGSGPSAPYASSSYLNRLVAGTDPVALDIWAVKNILMPQIEANGFGPGSYGSTQDPDNPDSTFRRYLDRSLNELLRDGIETTNVYENVHAYIWAGDSDKDGDVDLLDFAYVNECVTGPSGGIVSDCDDADLDADGDVDLIDVRDLQLSFTGPL